jgi:hypothetical protein
MDHDGRHVGRRVDGFAWGPSGRPAEELAREPAREGPDEGGGTLRQRGTQADSETRAHLQILQYLEVPKEVWHISPRLAKEEGPRRWGGRRTWGRPPASASAGVAYRNIGDHHRGYPAATSSGCHTYAEQRVTTHQSTAGGQDPNLVSYLTVYLRRAVTPAAAPRSFAKSLTLPREMLSLVGGPWLVLCWCPPQGTLLVSASRDSFHCSNDNAPPWASPNFPLSFGAIAWQGREGLGAVQGVTVGVEQLSPSKKFRGRPPRGYLSSRFRPASSTRSSL